MAQSINVKESQLGNDYTPEEIFALANSRLQCTASALAKGLFDEFSLDAIADMKGGVSRGLEYLGELNQEYVLLNGESHPDYCQFVQMGNRILSRFNERLGVTQ